MATLVQDTVHQVSVLAVGEDVEAQQSPQNCCLNLLFSMRTKTALSLIILFGILIVSVLVVLVAVFIPGFNIVETTKVTEASQRALLAMYDDIENYLQNAGSNFGAWNETYARFTPARSSEIDGFLEGNFPAYIMRTIQLNIVAAYHSDSSLAFARTYNLETNSYNTEPVIPALLNPTKLIQAAMTSPSAKSTGLVLDAVNKTVMLVVAAPIVTSEYNGPVRGAILYGRYISLAVALDYANRAQVCTIPYTVAANDPAIAKLNIAGSASLAVTPIADDNSWTTAKSLAVENYEVGAKFPNRRCRTSNGEDALVEARIGSFVLFNDIDAKPVLVLRFDSSRVAYVTGINSMGIAIGVAAGVSILVSFCVLIFIECCVVTPMLGIANKVFKIAETKNVNQHVPKSALSQKDELENLTTNINCFLDKLADAERNIINEKTKLDRLRHKKQLEELRSRSIMNSIKDFIFNVDMEGKFVWSNNSVQTILRYAQQKTWNIELVFPKIPMHQFQELANTKTTMEAEAVSSDKQEAFFVKLYVTKVTVVIDEKEIETLVILAKNQSDLKEVLDALKKEQNKAEVLKLGMIFDTMMRTPDRRAKYKQFCTSRKEEEYILFLEAVEAYKATKTASERTAKHAEIIKNFLSNDSDFHLSAVFKSSPEEVLKVKEGKLEVDLFKFVEKIAKNHLLETSFGIFEKQP